MAFKDYIKRLFRYIIKGIPNNNVEVRVAQINYGKILCNRTILVTGGDRGLGFSIAKKCIEEGAKVIIVARNEEKLEKAVDVLGANCKCLKFDLENTSKLDDVILDANELFDTPIDSLICNAGISLHEKDILNVVQSEYEQQMKINLESPYFITQAFIKHNEDVAKSIIFMSSERGFQCDDVPYGLSKAALNSLTRGLARRFYKKGIRVNGIAPGITATDMTQVKQTQNMYAENQVAERYFIPEEIAEVTTFLLSDASKCISGEIIACDAGQYISSYY